MAKDKRDLTPEIIPGRQLDVFEPKGKNRHPNIIINSRHEYSVLEKKMIYCIINQLDANMDVQSDLFGDIYFKIPVATFGKDYSHSTLKEAIKKIHDRKIEVDDGKQYFVVNPIGMGKIKEGLVVLKLQAEAVPYFIDLKKYNYTSYQLDIALSLTSVYSQRLFELLSRWKDTGKWYVEIAKLKHLLAINDKKAYEKHSNFVNKVLEPAKAELAEKTDIQFDYSFKKQGRQFHTIEFDIYTKKLLNHIEKAEAKEDAIDVMEQLAEVTPVQQMTFLHTALANYTFNDRQKRSILDSQLFINKFLEIHTQIMTKAIEVKKTPTHLMAWHLKQLGWK